MSQRTKSHGLAVFKAGAPFQAWEFDLNPLGSHDVEFRLTHCGICHSDLHTVHGDWGDQKWPIVPGHELVGHVTAVGSEVKDFKVGQRVGVGAQVGSCGVCKFCLMGQESYCQSGPVLTYGSTIPGTNYVTKGGYALYQRTNERFVFAIPDNLPSASVAPTLCAGITVFAPLKNLKVGKGSRVGVIGVGGLGHLALQFARALGAEVTAISSSANKEAEARDFGAQHFFLLSDEKAVSDAANSLDVLINTASVHYNYGKLLSLLQPFGHFVQLGAPAGDMPIPSFPLLFKNLSLSGSLIGPPGYIREMLEVASKHNIVAQVEVVSWERVNEAVKRVLENKARYRMVLEMPKEDVPANIDVASLAS